MALSLLILILLKYLLSPPYNHHTSAQLHLTERKGKENLSPGLGAGLPLCAPVAPLDLRGARTGNRRLCSRLPWQQRYRACLKKVVVFAFIK